MSRLRPPTSRARYAFDDLNRLLLTGPGRAADRLRPVHVLEGTVSTDSQNRLIYRVAESADRDGQPGPQAFTFDGTWKLTADHRLAMTVHETERSPRQTLFLNASLLQADAHALVFALRRSERSEEAADQRLTLSGRWRADAQNRLNFLIEKSDGEEDRLVFQSGWEVGPHHELLYRLRRGSTGGGTRALIFDGAWDVTQGGRLVYRLAGASDSSFEFKAALQSRSLLAREGRLVYQVGIGVAQSRTEWRRVTLFGTWKVNRDVSVSFEVPYADGRVQAIRFEGSAALGPRNRVVVALLDRRRRPMGLTVVFSRELVPDAELFLRLHRDGEERSVVGGVRVRF